MRILRVLRGAILWLVIIALALFLIFVEFVADVGGKAEPIRRPVNVPSGLAPVEQAIAGAEPSPSILPRAHGSRLVAWGLQLEDQLAVVVPHQAVRRGNLIPGLLGTAPGPYLQFPSVELPGRHLNGVTPLHL